MRFAAKQQRHGVSTERVYAAEQAVQKRVVGARRWQGAAWKEWHDTWQETAGDWSGYISVRDAVIGVELSAQAVSDEDLPSLMKHLDWLLQSVLGENGRYVLNIDLSCNWGISDDGVTAHLVPLLKRWPACHRLKLYKTTCGDRALKALGAWVSGGHARELHLSDLGAPVSGQAVLDLLRQAQARGKYPYWQDGCRCALWIRLEHNGISKPEELVSRGEAEGLSLCIVSPSSRHAIGVWHSSADMPAVYLAHFHTQDLRVERYYWSGQRNDSTQALDDFGTDKQAPMKKNQRPDRDVGPGASRLLTSTLTQLKDQATDNSGSSWDSAPKQRWVPVSKQVSKPSQEESNKVHRDSEKEQADGPLLMTPGTGGTADKDDENIAAGFFTKSVESVRKGGSATSLADDTCPEASEDTGPSLPPGLEFLAHCESLMNCTSPKRVHLDQSRLDGSLMPPVLLGRAGGPGTEKDRALAQPPSKAEDGSWLRTEPSAYTSALRGRADHVATAGSGSEASAGSDTRKSGRNKIGSVEASSQLPEFLPERAAPAYVGQQPLAQVDGPPHWAAFDNTDASWSQWEEPAAWYSEGHEAGGLNPYAQEFQPHRTGVQQQYSDGPAYDGRNSRKDNLWILKRNVGWPLAIRAVPDINGPRTGYVLQPGQMFQALEERVGVDGVIYLRLRDGLGWVFNSKPGFGVVCERFGDNPRRNSGVSVTSQAQMVPEVRSGAQQHHAPSHGAHGGDIYSSKKWHGPPPGEFNVRETRFEGALRAMSAFVECGDPRLREAIQRIADVGWEGVTWRRGYTALHLAAEIGQNDAVPLLLALGADPWAMDWKGRTAFDVAEAKGHHDCAAALSRVLETQQRKASQLTMTT